MGLLTNIKQKKEKKTKYRLLSNSEKKERYQNKWYLTYEKLPIQKN